MKASEADKFKEPPSVRAADIGVLAADADEGGHDHGGGHGSESIRTATHCGHEIVIKTCYEITVDGKSLASHLSVDDDGTLHTHALPEYAFSSAVDLVKKIIDAFPEEFPCDDEQGHDHGGKGASSGQQGHGHGGHTHKHP
jgi:hypothetical protein